MKKLLAILLAVSLLAVALAGVAALAENSSSGNMNEAGDPPAMPEGENGQPGDAPEKPDGDVGGGMGQPGDAPEKPDGEMGGMGDAPGGDMGGTPGGMGGGSSQPESYDAVNTFSESTTLTGEAIESTGKDENAVLVVSGDTVLSDVTITRESADSTGGDNASFYGVGACVLVTGGSVEINESAITSDADGAAGVFAYGDGVATVNDTVIHTSGNTAGGIHVAGGGTLYANSLEVTTEGESSAAIRSDRGSGTMRVNGGTYTSNGTGSPAVYVTADIAINNAVLTATGSEALCLEGKNSVALYDCALYGDMNDDGQNDNTWTVILYQSMSGDSEIGEGRFEMNGGSLTSANGGLFYTTNTTSEFVLTAVDITAAEDCEYFLRCTGNSNARGWGSAGSNGADCAFTAIAQRMDGDILWDSISELDLYVTGGSVLTGAVLQDESCVTVAGSGYCHVNIDAGSTWVVTADSALTRLTCEGSIVDADGNAVTVLGTDGTVYREGTSAVTVTVGSYSAVCDLSGAGTATDWVAG